MAHKKIVFVIVEGPSDEEALGVILSRIYDDSTVYVQIMHCDITTEFINAPNKNIVTMVGDQIREYANSNHFKKSDFKEIIHLVDMDGAYIPDDNVIEDTSAIKPIYSLTEIRSCNKRGIKLRNERKSTTSTGCVAIKKYGIFHIECSICPAILIMYFITSLTAPMMKRKQTLSSSQNSTKTRYPNSFPLSQSLNFL